MNLSQFGQWLAQDSPIVQLMEDLGEALSRNPEMLFLGGGNPAQVPEAQACFAKHLQQMAQDPQAAARLLGVYAAPQGDDSTLRALANYLAGECGWPVDQNNIALVSGSQLAFFILLNCFAGSMEAGRHKQVVLPLVPEYLGYGTQGLHRDFFVAYHPLVQLTGEQRFKYEVDFSQLDLRNASAVCLSRPTNPSGNLLGDAEIEHLLSLTRAANIPLLVDLAYGSPFPGLVYSACDTRWQPGMVSVLSLSKLGLPGVRTAVVVADEKIIQWVARANTIMSLANGNLGPALLERMINSGDLKRLSAKTLPDFYRRKRDFLLQLLDRHLRGLPYRIHESEGAFFVWLWLEGLPVTTQTLYQSLKSQGVLVMAGEPFFFGWAERWQHARECLRLTYCQPDEVLERAVLIIAHELRALYKGV
jgi:valine--pyruvate aminotransferase